MALLLAVCGVTGQADEPARATKAEEPDVPKLIRELNSPNYQRRQAAAAALTSLGEQSREALTEALDSPDPETRLAVQRILRDVSRDDFDKTLQALLDDKTGSLEHRLPLWPEYRAAIGFTAEARAMYVEMLKAETALMTEVSERPRTAGGYFYTRCQELRTESYEQGREMPTASIAAMMFIAADERVPISSSANSLLSSFCHQSGVRPTLKADAAPSVMRTLVGRWIADGRGGNYALRLAMQFNMKEGIAAAQTLIKDSTVAYYKQYAALAIAKLGTLEDASPLNDLLADSTTCSSHTVNNVKYTAELRDFALVAIIHLHGKDPKEFGFDRLMKNDQYLYLPHSLGFATQEARTAAFAKWAAAKADLDSDE